MLIVTAGCGDDSTPTVPDTSTDIDDVTTDDDDDGDATPDDGDDDNGMTAEPDPDEPEPDEDAGTPEPGCSGTVDECGVCDGPGIPEGQCDCDGNVADECGVCGGNGIPEGQCDCDGNVLDECGTCGGTGIPEGECDCDGNVLDECGTCGGTGIPEGACDCDGNTLDRCEVCGGDGTSCNPLYGRYASRTVGFGRQADESGGLDVVSKAIIYSTVDVDKDGVLTEHHCFVETASDVVWSWSRPAAAETIPDGVAQLVDGGDGTWIRQGSDDTAYIGWDPARQPDDCVAGETHSTGCLCSDSALPVDPADCRVFDMEGDSMPGATLYLGINGQPVDPDVAPSAATLNMANVKSMQWVITPAADGNHQGSIQGGVSQSELSGTRGGDFAELFGTVYNSVCDGVGHVEFVPLGADEGCAEIMAGRATDVTDHEIFDGDLDDAFPETASCPNPRCPDDATPAFEVCSTVDCGTIANGCGVEEDCGGCPDGLVCNDSNECICIPECDGKQCGDDGCGGSCGECAGDQDICNDLQLCECIPACDGRSCGDDGCGGSCGACEAGTACDEAGECAPCTPQCDGKQCGDDLCNGLCGTCAGDETCGETFQCVEAPDKNLLPGTYVTRSVIFSRQDGTDESKAIGYSIVSITDGDNGLQLSDKSCYAFTLPQNQGGWYTWQKASWARAIRSVDRPLTYQGDSTWQREAQTEALGWSGDCSCADDCVNGLPPFSSGTPGHCSLTDDDLSGNGGIAAWGSSRAPNSYEAEPTNFLSALVHVASNVSSYWTITPSADGRHVGRVGDAGSTQSIIGCTNSFGCGRLSPRATATCAEEANSVQFIPLADFNASNGTSITDCASLTAQIPFTAMFSSPNTIGFDDSLDGDIPDESVDCPHPPAP